MAVLSNADLRSEYFGVTGDVTEPLVAAFKFALSDLNEDTTEALFLEASRAAIETNLRSAILYASRMDEAAAAGEADLVRESQFDGLTYFHVIAPLVAALDLESAPAIEAAFMQGADSGVGQVDLSGAPVLDDVVQAAERILEAAGVDVGSFGTSALRRTSRFPGEEVATFLVPAQEKDLVSRTKVDLIQESVFYEMFFFSVKCLS